MLKEDFNALVLDNAYDSISCAFILYFDFDSDSVKWHARLGSVRQDRMSKLAKGLLNQLTRVKLPRCELCIVDKVTISIRV